MDVGYCASQTAYKSIVAPFTFVKSPTDAPSSYSVAEELGDVDHPKKPHFAPVDETGPENIPDTGLRANVSFATV